MARQFSDDDRDKEVVTSDGDRVGRIRDVDGDSATVDEDESLSEKITSMLGWNDDEAPREIRSEQVDSNTMDYVRLKQKW